MAKQSEEPAIVESNEGKAGSVDLIPDSPQTLALIVLASLAVCYSLYFAKAILLPVTVAVVLNFLLSPLVRRLARLHIPSWIGAGLVLFTGTCVVASAVALLFQPASQWLDELPAILRQSESRFKSVLEPIERFEKASKEIEKLTDGKTEEKSEGDPLEAGLEPDEPLVGNDPGPYEPPSLEAAMEASDAEEPEDEVVKVEVQQPSLASVALNSTTTALAGALIALVLLYFLLSSDSYFLRVMLRSVETLTAKKGIVEIAHALEVTISRFLLSYTCINMGLGIAVGTVMWLFGLPNPVLWGVMAGLLNYAPYVGFFVGAFLVGLVSLDTFPDRSIWYCMLPSAIYMTLNSIEGNLITPAIWGRSFQQSPVAILLSILFWGWIWGTAGVLLAVPLLMIGTTCLSQIQKVREQQSGLVE